MFRWLINKLIDVARLTHSVKTVIAIFIGFLLTRIVSFPAEQWVIITIIVVMCTQLYVGSVMQKAYLRFLGTLTGCLFAIITIVYVGNTNIAIATTIASSAFIFSYLATKREDLSAAGTLGAVTTTIIMLGQKPTVWFAVERFLEISMGLLIATLVSQFVLPIHARTHLRRAQADALEQFLAYYHAIIATHTQSETIIDLLALEENIVKSLLKQRQLAKDSKREPLGSAFAYENFMQTLYCEREILRAITMMETALAAVNKLNLLFTQQPAVVAFNQQIEQTFNALIKIIDSSNPSHERIPPIAMEEIKTLIHKNRDMYSDEEFIYLNGFLFSAEVLVGALNKLERFLIFT